MPPHRPTPDRHPETKTTLARLAVADEAMVAARAEAAVRAVVADEVMVAALAAKAMAVAVAVAVAVLANQMPAAPQPLALARLLVPQHTPRSTAQLRTIRNDHAYRATDQRAGAR